MLAHFTQDRGLLRSYRDNQDLHGLTAATAFGKDYTPKQRGLAKSSNFALLYGAGPGTMVRRYQIPTMKMAKELSYSFYKTFPRVKPWKLRVIKEAKSRYQKGVNPPYVMTILGRKRRLPGLNSNDNTRRSAAERQAISVTISGSAADLFKVIMINCFNELNTQEWEGHILMTVHDELVVEVPEEYGEEALALVKGVMEKVINPFTGEEAISVPLIAEAKIVKRWSDAKS
jgi:DNA polymerase-1